MTEETPKKPRRKRRTKAQIEADKAAKAAAAAEVKEMEAAGFEHVRSRDEQGHFVKDDPSTPENEAWEWVKKEGDDIPYEPVVRPTSSVYDNQESTPATYIGRWC